MTEQSTDIFLFPSQADALACRKQMLMSSGSAGEEALFGAAFTTFDSWIADLWELMGDGRTIVSPAHRSLALSLVFSGCEADFGASSDAMSDLAARCLTEASGLALFEKAVSLASRCAQGPSIPLEDGFEGRMPFVSGDASASATDGLNEREVLLLSCIGSYYRNIEELGLIEFGHVLALLHGRLGCLGPTRVIFKDSLPLPVRQSAFLAAAGIEAVIEYAPGVEGVERAEAGIDVRFAFPSGKYAQPHLLLDIVRDSRADGRIVLVGPQSRNLYAHMAPLLESDGSACAMKSRVSFPETDFGRAVFALHACLNPDTFDRAFFADYLLTPFSGISVQKAYAIDAEIRKNRLAEKDDCFSALRRESTMLDMMEDIVDTPDADVLCGCLEDYVNGMRSRSEAYRAEQLSAIRSFRAVTTAARYVGADMGACLGVLRRVSVEASCSSADVEGWMDAQVVFCDRGSVAALPRGAFATVVAYDLSSDDYPVSNKGDASSLLLGKLGIRIIDDALIRARCSFSSIVRLPDRRLVLERCLNDAAADPTYPSIVLEEFIDCYRDDPSAIDDIDNVYALPETFQGGMYERGEELLFQNASLSDTGQTSAACVETPEAGIVSARKRPLIILPRVGKGGVVVSEPVLSPSQIESYLACPYLWFAHRRLRLSELDEGFGGVQMGDFAHHVFESFYRHFQEETGFRKVDEGNIAQARAIMTDVLERHAALQYTLEPSSSNRLVATSELEAREVAELSLKILRFLDYEKRLLPGFWPEYREFRIDVEDGIEYAGRKLIGSVDRIDVDDQGRAVIIDYKAAVGPDYALAARADESLGKVQALIYAQAIRRKLGLDVVGALYVSYGRTCKLTGAYDATVLDAAYLPNMRHEDCAYVPAEGESFGTLLDETEERIAAALDRMFEGEIEPAPTLDSACAWCPVVACHERRS